MRAHRLQLVWRMREDKERREEDPQTIRSAPKARERQRSREDSRIEGDPDNPMICRGVD